jgi:hypothetical protein
MKSLGTGKRLSSESIKINTLATVTLFRKLWRIPSYSLKTTVSIYVVILVDRKFLLWREQDEDNN